MTQTRCEPASSQTLDPIFGPPGAWLDLPAGTSIDIVKIGPDGDHVVTYAGTVLRPLDDDGWLMTEARWINRTVDLGGLVFHTGDTLIEWFSPVHAYNCFTVIDPRDGAVRGWYANVTRPATLVAGAQRPRLTWYDLYLDVVANPTGYVSLRDQDELEASGIPRSSPELGQAIVSMGNELETRARGQVWPFVVERPAKTTE